MKSLSRARLWLFLPLILFSGSWAQHVPGPEALSIPGPVATIHSPGGQQLSAPESFFRGAFPQAGARADFTKLVTWSISPANFPNVNISPTGLVTATTTACPNSNRCPFTVTATYRGLHASMNILVLSPQAVTIHNASTSQPSPLPQGEFQQLDAIATYADSFTCTPPPPMGLPGCNITNFVNWSSTDDKTVLHDARLIKGLVQAVAPSGSATISCIAVSTPCAGPITFNTASPALLFVIVTPRAGAVAKTGTLTFEAQGHYSADGAAIGISTLARSMATSTVTVTTTAPHNLKFGFPVDVVTASVAPDNTFAGSFVVTSAANPTTFTYTQAGADVASFTPNPGPPAPTVASSEHTLPFGSDTVTWATSPNGSPVASIDPNTGVATGNAAGTVGIVATPPQPGTQCLAGNPVGFGCLANLNVGLTGLSISPANPAPVARGATQQFTVTGTFSDGMNRPVTNSLFWLSSAANHVTVGTSPVQPPGTSPGLTTAVGHPGDMATISAQVFQPPQTCGTTALCITTNVTVGNPVPVSITVTPASPKLALGQSQQFTATENLSDGSRSNVTSRATFASTNTSVLSFGGAVASNGLGQTGQAGQGLGSANVTASADTFTSPPVAVTVNPAVISSIKVTPKNASLANGAQLQYVATATYTDGFKTPLPFAGDGAHAPATTVTWSSRIINQATIDANGNATAIGESGTTEISAISNGVEGETKLTVVPKALVSISLTPAPPTSLPVGNTQQFTATGTFSDNSQQDFSSAVSWSSDNPADATIDADGLATGIKLGSANISATYSGCLGSSKPPCTITPASIPLTVIAPTLKSIAVYVAPCAIPPTLCMSSASLNFGQQQQFVAIGTFSGVSAMQDITATVNWSTSDQTVATVDDDGLVTAAGAGGASVIATDPVTGISSNSGGMGDINGTVTVIAPTLLSVTVTPSNVSVGLNQTLQYTATGNYSDSSQQDLTSRVTWSTGSGGTTASIDPSGLVTGNSVGPDTVMALCPNDNSCQLASAPGPVNGATNVTVSF